MSFTKIIKINGLTKLHVGKEQTKSPSQTSERAINVIRLGFAKMRCFTEDSGTLLVLLVLVKVLIYNVISMFIAVRVNGKTLDFA